MERVVNVVGEIEVSGAFGRDIFVLITDLEDDIDVDSEEFNIWILDTFMYDRGKYFSAGYELFQRTKNSVLCIIHHRVDC
jgi:hypothetical protein